MAERFDLAIAGAGFAGLTAARRAAERGLKVVVLERKAEPGRPLHTTGILVKEAFDLLTAQNGPVPRELWREVPGVRLYSPSLKRTDLFSPGYAFYVTDTPGMLRWLAGEAARAGAAIRYTAPIQSLRQESEAVHIGAGGGAIEASWLLGADGAKSAVAEHAGLGRNRRFLVGLEAEFTGVRGVEANLLHTFLDRALAPGYIGWVVPGVGVTQVGIAAKRADRPEFEAFLARVKTLFDFGGAQLAERRSGVIPVGGIVRPAARGRVILIGDSAGMVSPLTAGGIFTALDFGARAAEAIADHLAGKAPDPALTLPRLYPKFRVKRWLRRALDVGPPNWLANLMLGTRPMQAFARLVYFHRKGLGSKAAWKDLVKRPNG
ncbi:MAG TPA: NAD(P)/FAD-dependent oxidoreductase [Thermoanaerobaculia bacterium]|nr:NAD(P)/FAD-dependent oxidoreductase [Thermoanaerobaculia bacterium]